jgi:hypothetical protein
VSAGLAQALISAAHRIAEAGLALRASAAAHHVALAKATAGRRDRSAGSPPDPAADLQPSLDVLADGVSQATALIAGALRQLGAGPAAAGPPALPPLPKLRPMVQALRAGPDAEREGLFVAADSLVDAINSAAYVLRGSASDDRRRASDERGKASSG